MSVFNNRLFINPFSLLYKCQKLKTPITKIVAGSVAIATAIYNSAIQNNSPMHKALLGTGLCTIASGVIDCYNTPMPARERLEIEKPKILRPAIENLPPEFWDELETSNQNKINAPLALLLYPEHDHNGVFSSSETQSTILQIAKKHRLAIRTIRNANEVRQIIINVTEQYGPFGELYIAAHGCPTLIRFGNDANDSGSVYTASEDHNEHFHDYKGKNIYLMSCSTGPELAPKIARKSTNKVWASMTPMDPTYEFAYPCASHHSDMRTHLSGSEDWEWPNGQLDMRIFHPNRTQTIPCQNDAIRAAIPARKSLTS